MYTLCKLILIVTLRLIFSMFKIIKKKNVIYELIKHNSDIMKSFWKSKIAILFLIMSIIIPLIVIKISYCLNIEGYNISGAIALFGVFLSSLGVYYSNEKSNERIGTQLRSQEENLKKQLIFNKKQEILSEFLQGINKQYIPQITDKNSAVYVPAHKIIFNNLGVTCLFLKDFKESCKTIYLDDITQSKIDEYLKIYEKYDDTFNIVKTELDRINMKFTEDDFKSLQKLAIELREDTKEKLRTGDF